MQKFIIKIKLSVTYHAGVSVRCPPPAAAPTIDLPSDDFDYVIIGGGLAGCLMANRLSTNPDKKVLVVEAGEDNKDFIVKARSQRVATVL
jgi:hypothetical protein